MSQGGKVQVKVRSRRVPMAVFHRTEPIYSTSGVLVGHRPVTEVLYGTRLDDEHRRTIEGAQRLATYLGLGLEIVDESKLGVLGSLVSRLTGGRGRLPAVVVSPSANEVGPDSLRVLTDAGQ